MLKSLGSLKTKFFTSLLAHLTQLTQLTQLTTPVLIPIIAISTFSISESAKAYDTDTHFYETYILARYVGIGHDVALHFATFNEYIDQNSWTSPMNPLLLTGTRTRRLFHFPIPLVNRYSYSNATKQFGIKLNVLDLAQENSPMGNELLWTGLKKGDMQLVGAGLHVLMDTFGHAGYSPSIGHLYQGHGPDRANQAYEKHRRMATTLIKVLSLVRKALPDSALDKNFRDGAGPAHVDLDGPTLAEKYDQNDRIQDVIKRDTLRDPRYTRYVVEFMIQEAKNRKIFAASFDPQTILNDEKHWATELSVDEFVIKLAKRVMILPKEQRDNILNMKTITEWVMKDYGMNEAKFDIMPREERDLYILEFARRVFGHIVPKEINKDHPVMFEYDHGVRKAEMLIRISDRQQIISDLFGTRVAFTSKLYDRAAHEIEKAVTDGRAFDGANEVDQLEKRIDQAELLNLAKSDVGSATAKQSRSWKWKMFKYIYLDLAVGAIGYRLKRLGLMKEKTQFGNMRFDPSRGAALYQRERAFELMMQFGIIKKLATDDEIRKMRAEHEQENAKLRESGLDVDEAIRKVTEEFKGRTIGELIESTIGRQEKLRAQDQQNLVQQQGRPRILCRDIFSH